MEVLPNIILFTVAGLYLLLLVFILAWVYHDAEQRGLNGWLITALAFFSGTIFGTLVWLVLRPRLEPQTVPVRS
ncbi:hypothetical protein ABID22_000961 [Pontibacter aydingkolensis]|uniref:Phospholipase_D-nuclease N-terminal n=1 Tax=Pontibacter aydingkolensis TaxID=1911536 RepID=A0ABS7CSH2_9BACT|nr:hypothetical protein [Pontibacter aydingkolensis]MBW7466787.1 hypothetical protein [Pontibacter aydingkolensis]